MLSPLLLQQLNHPDLDVRKAAIRGYLADFRLLNEQRPIQPLAAFLWDAIPQQFQVDPVAYLFQTTALELTLPLDVLEHYPILAAHPQLTTLHLRISRSQRLSNSLPKNMRHTAMATALYILPSPMFPCSPLHGHCFPIWIGFA